MQDLYPQFYQRIEEHKLMNLEVLVYWLIGNLASQVL